MTSSSVMKVKKWDTFEDTAMKVISLMEIKDFSQCIAANKQQWCGLVAADSCGIVAAYVGISEDAKYSKDGRHNHRQVSHTEISDHRTVPKRHRTYGAKHKDTVSRGTSMHEKHEKQSCKHDIKPKQAEEVTYVFSVEDSPSHAKKPQSFEQKLQSTRDGREKSVWRKASGRRTPHARTKYDTYIQTPGSADDKPLVTAQVMAARDITPDDEESVRLLDRYYRPLDNRVATSGDEVLMIDDDEGYTENFTIV